MELEKENLEVAFPAQLADVDSEAFNRLVGPDEPFLRYEFLSALEESRCVSPETGWIPHHFLVRDATGAIVAFAPVYLKQHSYGEYVFDWAWADAYQRHGYSYYPKLLCSIPFTPSVSNRLLCSSSNNVLISELYTELTQDLLKNAGYSSSHILFPKPGSFDHHESLWLERKGVQYHWHNRDQTPYTDFDDFLSELNSAKRKNIRKERKRLKEQGVRTEWVNATTLSAEQFDFFIRCYERTYNVRGQMAYLNREFFEKLFKGMGNECLLLFAFDPENKPIASALFLLGRDVLYGRYWGAIEERNCLHFELCYYSGIDYCIEHKLHKFDAGAQGEHKLLRGFEPVTTYSYHYINHPEFRDAIDNFLSDECEHIERFQEDARRWLPYKKQP